jgi:hypothetical protein
MLKRRQSCALIERSIASRAAAANYTHVVTNYEWSIDPQLPGTSAPGARFRVPTPHFRPHLHLPQQGSHARVRGVHRRCDATTVDGG